MRRSQACLDYAMARKGREKPNVFLEPSAEAELVRTMPRREKGRVKPNKKIFPIRTVHYFCVFNKTEHFV